MLNIDLYSARFWVFASLAFVIFVPLHGPRLRNTTLAFLNLSFLAIHLTCCMSLIAMGLLVAVWIILRLIGSGRFRTAFAVSGGLTLLLLFAIHKLPLALAVPILPIFKSMLATIGFSFIFLRIYEVGNAVLVGRHRPPSFVSLINYLVPFHMLAAGPIQSYVEFVSQPAVPPPLSLGRSLAAIERITLGLFKKYVLANMIENMLLTGLHTGGLYFLVEVQFWAILWLFIDFSRVQRCGGGDRAIDRGGNAGKFQSPLPRP